MIKEGYSVRYLKNNDTDCYIALQDEKDNMINWPGTATRKIYATFKYDCFINLVNVFAKLTDLKITAKDNPIDPNWFYFKKEKKEKMKGKWFLEFEATVNGTNLSSDPVSFQEDVQIQLFAENEEDAKRQATIAGKSINKQLLALYFPEIEDNDSIFLNNVTFDNIKLGFEGNQMTRQIHIELSIPELTL